VFCRSERRGARRQRRSVHRSLARNPHLVREPPLPTSASHSLRRVPPAQHDHAGTHGPPSYDTCTAALQQDPILNARMPCCATGTASQRRNFLAVLFAGSAIAGGTLQLSRYARHRSSCVGAGMWPFTTPTWLSRAISRARPPSSRVFLGESDDTRT